MDKVPKSGFNEIKDLITRSNDSRLVRKRKTALKNAEKLLKGIISRKIEKKEARKMYNSIADDANKLNRLELTKLRKKMLPIFKQLQKIFMGPKADDKVDDEADDNADDEADDEADNEADNDMDYKTEEQPNTTDIPDLESEESAEQRRKQKGQGLKILTPQHKCLVDY